MKLTSLAFLLFLAGLLAVYYLVPKKLQWVVLLAGSCGFYLWAGPEYGAFLLFTVLSTYLFTRLMAKNLDRQDAYLAQNKQTLSREEKKAYKAAVKKKNRLWMCLCLLLNFGILAVCKFCLLPDMKGALSETGLSFLTLGLPMGISFYMFQSMGYVVDVYRGTVKAERNLGKLSLFVSFFPQLIQGPISKFSQIAGDLYAPKAFDSRNLSYGLQRILWGFFKKLVIADRIAPAVGALKDPALGGMGFLLLTLCYAIQIYGDFTGGIDIALGAAECFGIHLPENFRRPFFSKNIAEYWRRWHISLGEWMKDYIFYPISVSQPMLKLTKAGRAKFGDIGKRIPVYIATVATWFVTGIWHGLTPNFVLWGMLNCVFIIGSQELIPLYARFHGRFGWKEKGWYGAFEMLRMFILMNLIRACDLFPRVSDYFRGLTSVFTAPNFRLFSGDLLKTLKLSGLDLGILAGGTVVLFLFSLLQEKHGSVREYLASRPAWLRWSLIFVLLVTVLLMGSYGIGYNSNNFIYNQF